MALGYGVSEAGQPGTKTWDVEWLRMDQDSNLEELYDRLKVSSRVK